MIESVYYEIGACNFDHQSDTATGNFYFGFIFPVEAMPSCIQPVAYIIPFTYFVGIIRGILLKENVFIELMPNFLALCMSALFFTLFSIFRFRKTLS